MTHLRNEGPIGVFDSGLGGLTVLAALRRRLPLEDFVYLGDTARSPYGTRGKQTILNYAHACARVLRDYRIKLLVLACSSASAVAMEPLARELFIPTLGAIYPGLEAALLSGATRIGVLSSAYLARTRDYGLALAQLAPEATPQVQSAQRLCALLDDGVSAGELASVAIRDRLAPLVEADVQALVLGESALALWRNLIDAELAAMSGKNVPVIDCVEPLAAAAGELVASRQLATGRTDPGKLRIVLTDMPDDLELAQRFFGQTFAGVSVKSVDL